MITATYNREQQTVTVRDLRASPDLSPNTLSAAGAPTRGLLQLHGFKQVP
jgi:hypothetical protein